jgi:hypothetical protein
MSNKAPKGKGSRAKLREYFLNNIGKVLNSDTLREVAGTSEWGRRVRELRNEEGMNIVTHNDRSELKPGQYLLINLKPLPAFERNISKETRAFVLDRNGFTCQMCGDKTMGGEDDPSMLRAICSVCNEGASNLTLNRPQAIKLLAQIRRSPTADQLDILKWIIEKFPKQAEALLKKRKT